MMVFPAQIGSKNGRPLSLACIQTLTRFGRGLSTFEDECGVEWMRINIDTEFFGDERVELLADALGENKFSARGRVVSVWFKNYLKLSPVLTSKEINLAAGHPEMASLMVAADLAEVVDDGILVRGVAQRIAWLVEKKEAGRLGGLKSAASRVAKFGSASPEANKKQTRRSASQKLQKQNGRSASVTTKQNRRSASENGITTDHEANAKQVRSTASQNAKLNFASPEAPQNPPDNDIDIDLKPQTPSLRERAADLCFRICGAAQEFVLDELSAKRELGADIDFAKKRFGSWERFVKAYSTAYQSGNASGFEREFRLGIRGQLASRSRQSMRHDQMEDLFPCES